MEEKYIYPTYIAKEKCWAVKTQLGIEKGSIEYVLGEFVNGGLVYRFNGNGNEYHSHCHTFSEVLAEVAKSPESISIDGFEKDYSEQEIRFLKNTRSAFMKLKETDGKAEVIFSEDEKCWVIRREGKEQKSELLEHCIDLVVCDSLTFNYISYDKKVIHQHGFALLLSDLVREPKRFISFENCENDYSEQELEFLKQIQIKLLEILSKYGENKLVKVEKYDEMTLKLTFKYGEKKLFNLNSVLEDEELSENYRNRFKLMFENERFFDAEVYCGDLVWRGWCEIFSEDLNKYLENF